MVAMRPGMGMKMEMMRTDFVSVVHRLAVYTTARSLARSLLNYVVMGPNSTPMPLKKT